MEGFLLRLFSTKRSSISMGLKIKSHTELFTLAPAVAQLKTLAAISTDRATISLILIVPILSTSAPPELSLCTFLHQNFVDTNGN